MSNELSALIDILPKRLRDDEGLRLQVVSLTTRASMNPWRILYFDDNYKLLNDLLRIHNHHIDRKPLKSWHPRSDVLRESWREPSEWTDGAWKAINETYIKRNERNLWALALAYSNTSSRRDARMKWLIATILTIATATAAILVAAEKSGIL